MSRPERAAPAKLEPASGLQLAWVEQLRQLAQEMRKLSESTAQQLAPMRPRTVSRWAPQISGQRPVAQQLKQAQEIQASVSLPI